MNRFLRRVTVLLMTLLLIFSMAVISYAEEKGEEWEEAQNESRAIDDPSYDLFPGEGGAGLLFTMLAEDVPASMYSNNQYLDKRFQLADLPSAATSIRFYGQLYHSKAAEGETFYYEPILCGVCYFDPWKAKYVNVKTQETYSGEIINTTFSIDEYITNDNVYYYGFITNSYVKGYVYGTLSFYYMI